jgi:hypothetical protein
VVNLISFISKNGKSFLKSQNFRFFWSFLEKNNSRCEISPEKKTLMAAPLVSLLLLPCCFG